MHPVVSGNPVRYFFHFHHVFDQVLCVGAIRRFDQLLFVTAASFDETAICRFHQLPRLSKFNELIKLRFIDFLLNFRNCAGNRDGQVT